jgi:hypothetical protein
MPGVRGKCEKKTGVVAVNYTWVSRAFFADDAGGSLGRWIMGLLDLLTGEMVRSGPKEGLRLGITLERGRVFTRQNIFVAAVGDCEISAIGCIGIYLGDCMADVSSTVVSRTHLGETTVSCAS